MIDEIILKSITSDNSQLPERIKLAIGNPNPDKIAKVIQSYHKVNNYLMGAYLDNNLIGMIGYLQTTEQINIRHISVLPVFQHQGIGTLLLDNVKQQYPEHELVTETDTESVAFYQKCGFICNSFQGRYNGLRYKCEFNLY